MTRLLSLALLAVIVVAWPTQDRAQVAAPSLVDEDLPAEEPPPRPQGEPVPALPPAPPEEPKPASTASAATESAGQGARPLELVRGRYEDILQAWQARRAALREQSTPEAQAAERRILDLRRELDIENLDSLASAEVRASARALDARAPAEAFDHAQLAVMIAPDLAGAYLALAEARLARDPWSQLAAAAKDLADAAKAVWREPHTRRALLGDVIVAALAAAFVAGALVVALLFSRRLRMILHDAHHLPFLRLATPLQAYIVVLVVLALPVALRLGPALLLAMLALTVAPYLVLSERIVATVALAAVAFVPWGAQRAAALTAWTGTLAEDVYVLEQGADDGRIAAKLEARAGRGELPAAALVALGRHHKRRGDLAGALRWYDAAGTSRPDALVDKGNVRFLQGDLVGAKAEYLSAIDRAGATGDVTALAAVHYDLSKLFSRTATTLNQVQEARRKAVEEDAAFVERFGSDDDFRANRWLIDLPVPAAEVAGLAVDEAPRAVGDALHARLGGALPSTSGSWLLFCVSLILWPVALVRRVGVSRACERCGQATCARCGPATSNLCGQCVNVFSMKGVVEPRDRLRKQRQVKRYERNRRFVARTLAVMSGGGGHLWCGRPVRGAVVLFLLAFLAAVAVFWRGVVPPLHSTRWDAIAKLGLAIPCALGVWWLAVRNLFERT